MVQIAIFYVQDVFIFHCLLLITILSFFSKTFLCVFRWFTSFSNVNFQYSRVSLDQSTQRFTRETTI